MKVPKYYHYQDQLSQDQIQLIVNALHDAAWKEAEADEDSDKQKQLEELTQAFLTFGNWREVD